MIDDLNEICDVLDHSQKEYINQRYRDGQALSEDEADKKNQEILKKTLAINYRGYTIDRIYNEHNSN